MTVRIHHPDLDIEVTVSSSAVPFHRLAGWEPVEGQQDMGEEWPAEALPFEGRPIVRLRHPDLDQEVRVVAASVPFHRAQGWLVVDEEPAPAPTPGPSPARRRRGQQQEAESATTAEQTSEEG